MRLRRRKHTARRAFNKSYGELKGGGVVLIDAKVHRMRSMYILLSSQAISVDAELKKRIDLTSGECGACLRSKACPVDAL